MMCAASKTWLCFYPIQVLAAEMLDHLELAKDQSLDQTGVVILHVGALEETVLSE